MFRYIKQDNGFITAVINSATPLHDATHILIESNLSDNEILTSFHYDLNQGLTFSPLKKFKADQNTKSKQIDNACKAAIISGFVSYALGEPYHYPSKTLDQQNLAASVLASYDPENAPDWTTPFWCSDAAGEWAFRPHTAAQIREVGRDAKSAIIAYQLRNESLQAAISAATTAEQLDLINF